jgi:hypothetical protein
MPTVREAHYRHAAHHLRLVETADALYKQGDTNLELANLGKYQDSKHLHWHIAAGQPLR